MGKRMVARQPTSRSRRARPSDIIPAVIIYAIVDDSFSPASPLGDGVETFIRREDAERFIEEVRGEDPQLAKYLRIDVRELDAGGLN